MSTPLLFTAVKKSFAATTVLHGLDFEVKSGELCVLLGPNGAGKSTAMALATGLESPDSGRVEIFGERAGAISARRQFAFVPQDHVLPPAVTGREFLNFMNAHFPSPVTITESATRFALEPFLSRPVRQLSGGQKRRLSLAAAFMTEAPLIILDEPTTGLDLDSRRQVFAVFREYVRKGGTILMTTHYLSEAEELAQRVVVLNHGRIVRAGSPQEIKKQFGFKRIRFHASAQPPISGCQGNGEGQWWIDSATPDQTLKDVVQWGQGQDIEVTPLSLEHVFDRLVNGAHP